MSDKRSLHQDQPNHYRLLKEMSPEMLNRLYGRQSDQSIIEQKQENCLGDVYQQTSWNPNGLDLNVQKTQELKSLLEKRKNEILTNKHKYGIQSYNNSDCGTTLNEAFSPQK